MTMKLFAAVALAVLIAVPAYAADVSTEIKEQNEKFDQAYAKHDFNALANMYEENAIVYPQASEIVKGREGIKKLWQSYEKDMTQVDYQTIEVLDAGDYAIQVGKYDATWQGKPDTGRYMTIWHKNKDGWRIARDIWYSNGS
jgi:uncharacterized protein (TIGR02246 family)